MNFSKVKLFTIIFVFVYFKGMNSLPSCPIGEFALNNQCVDCHPNCMECNGHELFNCTQCGIDEDGYVRFLHQGYCRLHCPRGFFQDRGRYTCEACIHNCELCMDSDMCLKCKGKYKLDNGVCRTTQCIDGM
ncbi:proprotein convertase subtilisin/kexin type 5-like [Protopterus annectens]|uniref:proprotein convertase subtilisin/kexin type 5-like n=1 Tax=Protopterus annectens TaxID=7888 RepID=UPI001CFBE5A1|nr:proprotein convertase subtilisin/kexin type 5-like [Protopterus annectens]